MKTKMTMVLRCGLVAMGAWLPVLVLGQSSLSYGLHLGSDYLDNNHTGELVSSTFAASYEPTALDRYKLAGSYTQLESAQAKAQPVVQGWGDTTLSYQRRFILGGNKQLWDIEGKVKLPTASEAEGLGTGEIDYTLVTGFYQRVGGDWLYGKLGYKWRGDADHDDYRNGYQAQIGASHNYTPRINIGANFSYQQASHRKIEDREELMLHVSYKISDSIGLTIYGNKGFTSASSKLSGGIQFSHRFKD